MDFASMVGANRMIVQTIVQVYRWALISSGEHPDGTQMKATRLYTRVYLSRMRVAHRYTPQLDDLSKIEVVISPRPVGSP